MSEERGGVRVTSDQVRAMQAGDYILHARRGQLRQISVHKTRLPLDPQGHVQRLGLVQAPNGTLYAAQHSLLHKSTSSGASWTHLRRTPPAGSWRLQFAADGSMIHVAVDDGGRPAVWSSLDEGESWSQIGAIDLATRGARADLGFSVTRTADGSLLLPVVVITSDIGADGTLHSGTRACRLYRSDDGGSTWTVRGTIGEWCHEANVTELPGGRLLAAVRYQRPMLPDDPPDLPQRTGAPSPAWPYKHVFVAHSDDGGASWSGLRQVAGIFGQCYGSAAALDDGTVVLVCDHRYPRSMGSGRAFVSRDGGETWEDEVYYLAHGDAAGYAASLSPHGEWLLSLTGSCYGEVDSGWDYCVGRTNFAVIRWRPI
jgi:hypothetical protein